MNYFVSTFMTEDMVGVNMELRMYKESLFLVCSACRLSRWKTKTKDHEGTNYTFPKA